MNLTGGSSDDTFNIGGVTTGTLNNIAGTITIDGKNGTDSVNVNDQSSTAGYQYGVTNSYVARGSTVMINYTAVENLTLNASSGIDTIATTSTPAGTAVTIKGGAGNDNFYIYGGNATLAGGAGDDLYAFNDYYATSTPLGHDTIIENSGEGSDTIAFWYVYAGVDINLKLTSEQEVMSGHLWLTLKNSAGGVANLETAFGSPKDDTLSANDLGNTLLSSGGNDILIGGAGNDSLLGGDGDDVFYASGGTDYLIGNSWTGGPGSDSYIFDTAYGAGGSLGSQEVIPANETESQTLDFSAFSASQPVHIDISNSTDWQTVTDFVLSLFISDGVAIQNVIGGSGDDTITGNSRPNYLYGGAGNDTLSAGDGNDTLEGAAGTDSLTGGAGNDVYIFDPLAGDDGYLGSDTVYEAATFDSDTLDFSNFADDQGIGSSGTPFSLASTSSQTVHSGVLTLTIANYNTAIENVIGGAGDDYITGNTQSNILDGRDGNDTLIGGDGADRLYGGGGDDVLQGNDGSDALYGQDGNDALWGGTGDDFLYGGDGNDTLSDYDHSGSTTESGADWFDGGNGIDQLYGYSGDDKLIGGAGDDTLDGGTGADVYKFIWHQGDYGLGLDTITQDASDTLDFSHFFATTYVAPNSTVTGDQTVSDDPESDPIVLGEEQVIRELLIVHFTNTSATATPTAPGTFTSSVAGVAVAPPDDAGTIQMFANGVQGDNVDSVNFYWDSNGNGILDAGDQLLGTDTDGSDGWSFDLPYDNSQGKWIADDGHSTAVDFGPGPAGMIAAAAFSGASGNPSTPALSPMVYPAPPSPVSGVLSRWPVDDGIMATIKADAYGGTNPLEDVTPPPGTQNNPTTVKLSDPRSVTNVAGGTASGKASANASVPGGSVRSFVAIGNTSTEGKANSSSPWLTDISNANIKVPATPPAFPTDVWDILPSFKAGDYSNTTDFIVDIRGVITVGWGDTVTWQNNASAAWRGYIQIAVGMYNGTSISPQNYFGLTLNVKRSSSPNSPVDPDGASISTTFPDRPNQTVSLSNRGGFFRLEFYFTVHTSLTAPASLGMYVYQNAYSSAVVQGAGSATANGNDHFSITTKVTNIRPAG